MKPQAICVCAVLQKTQQSLPSTANPGLRSEHSERLSKKVQRNLKSMGCFFTCSF